MRPPVLCVRCLAAHWNLAVFLCYSVVSANAWSCTEMVDVGGSMLGTELKFKCSQDLALGESKGDEYRCKDGPCIYSVGLCNNICDCDDRSDETDCEETTTPAPADINGCWVSQTTPTGNAFFIDNNNLIVDGKAVTSLIRVGNNRFATMVDGQLEKKVAKVVDGTIHWGNQDVWIPGPVGACTTTTLTTTAAALCTVPLIPVGPQSWSGTNCTSGATNVVQGTTCAITAAPGYTCTSPGLCGSDGNFAATGGCQGLCTVPTIPVGPQSWSGTNCASGATNVVEGTECTITAAAGYSCTSPGLCTGGNFEATGACQADTTTRTTATVTTTTATTTTATTTNTFTTNTYTSVTATVPTTATTTTSVTVTTTSITTSVTTFLVVATTVTTTTTPLQMPSLQETLKCAQKDVVYDPIDMVGHKLSIEPNISACLFRCRKTPGCAHFSYWIPGSHCHVQDAFANPEPDRLLFVSAPAGCVSGAGSKSETVRTMLEQKACFAKSRSYAPYVGLNSSAIHEQKIAEDVLHCQELCLNATWCTLFEFNTFSDVCHLMEDPPKYLEVAGDYLTSGPPLCPGHIYFTVTMENLNYDILRQHPDMAEALKKKIADTLMNTEEDLNDETVLDKTIVLKHGHHINRTDEMFTGHNSEVEQINEEENRWNSSTEAHVVIFSKKGIDFATKELKSTSRFSIEQKLTAALGEMEQIVAPAVHPGSAMYVAAVSPIKVQASDTLRGVARNGVGAWQKSSSMDDVKGLLTLRSTMTTQVAAGVTMAAGVFMVVGLYLAVVTVRGRARLRSNGRRALSATDPYSTYCPLTSSGGQAHDWDSPLRAPSVWGSRLSHQARQFHEEPSERAGLMSEPSLENQNGDPERVWET